MFIEISIVVAVLSVASGLTCNTPRNVVASSVSSVSISNDSVSSLTLALSARQHSPTGIPISSASGASTSEPISSATSANLTSTGISTTTTSEVTPFSRSTTSTASGSSAPWPIGAIVGASVVGGVLAINLVILSTFLIIRRCCRSRQDGFERGTFKHTEDEMKENPTSDRPIPLGQGIVTTEDISNPHVERRANSPLHGALFAPPTLFEPASPTLYLENPHFLWSAEALPSTHDMHLDTSDCGSSVTVSTARATLGGVRYKVASEADNIPSQNTDDVSAPEEVSPAEVICRDEEQPLDIASSDSCGNTTTAPLPPQAPNQTQELNNQRDVLTTEEDVLLLELREVQIARRLVEIRSTRNCQTPPPQYASS
ncbi:hypothetical protein BT96DRAFT_1009434 [Gymnopus androsaceus JB14]|uniref:Uncharacterized protein n=1 Tax=Gymnopus androsaceus JB14 TaxID=1447944 RepID=A0A6A4GCY7_9AGAR|nr:hypothetical protein BT96DRAFT_1009434 [Gymnopus androsaceus JB14]